MAKKDEAEMKFFSLEWNSFAAEGPPAHNQLIQQEKGQLLN